MMRRGKMLLGVVSMAYICTAYGAEAQRDLSILLSTKFKEFKEQKLFDFDSQAGVVAIPTKVNPASNKDELASGKIVGSVFLSGKSVRLGLDPGPYEVFVVKQNGEWKAQFLDAKGNAASTRNATVSDSSPVSSPVASVDHSICYQFDSTIICV